MNTKRSQAEPLAWAGDVVLWCRICLASTRLQVLHSLGNFAFSPTFLGIHISYLVSEDLKKLTKKTQVNLELFEGFYKK